MSRSDIEGLSWVTGAVGAVNKEKIYSGLSVVGKVQYHRKDNGWLKVPGDCGERDNIGAVRSVYCHTTKLRYGEGFIYILLSARTIPNGLRRAPEVSADDLEDG